jgi:exodeoxyribonuclease V alpha subunit
LIPLAKGLLDAPGNLVETALDLERLEGTVVDKVNETCCTFFGGLRRAERTIADRLIRVACGQLAWPSIDAAKALSWVEERGDLKLPGSQRAAVQLALTGKAGRASAKLPSSTRSCAFLGLRT